MEKTKGDVKMEISQLVENPAMLHGHLASSNRLLKINKKILKYDAWGVHFIFLHRKGWV